MFNIVLASKSIVRKDILNKNGINCLVFPANIDEETVKKSSGKITKNHGYNFEVIPFGDVANSSPKPLKSISSLGRHLVLNNSFELFNKIFDAE